SHVQGGWIGHEMRRSLAAWAPYAGISRGMHLPYRLAQTNTPTHFRTEMQGRWTAQQCTRGSGQAACAAAPIATGILAYPKDSTFIQHVSYLPDSTRNVYTSVELWTNANRSQWHWQGNSTLLSCSPLPENQGWRLELSESADTLAVAFTAPPASEIWYAGMSGLHNGTDAHIIFHEWGHNGLRIRHAAALRGWESLLQRIQPDLIFIGIGLNDAVDGERLNMAAFASHYEALTDVMCETGAAVVLVGNTPALHRSTSLAGPSASIGAWLRQHSQARGMAYMDLTAALGGSDLVTEWIEGKWMQPDGMHFTADGYQAIASVLFEAWIQAYAQAQKEPSLNNASDVLPKQ
ncbi:MAG: SGNH/GDSL hydrolase family protein, partial [Flavobacteriales bacterium]